MSFDFSDQDNLLLLACFEANRAWFDNEMHEGEKIHHERISCGKPLNGEHLKSFLVTWKVARNTKPEKRQELSYRLADLAKDYQDLEAIRTAGFSKAVEDLKTDEFTHGRAISLVSKYLFCAKPEVFSPYDQHARRALIKSGSKIDVANYSQFMDAFEAFHDNVSKRLVALNLSHDSFAYGRESMDSDLFARRVADKYLMLSGDFSSKRVFRLINGSRCSFQYDALKVLDNVIDS